MDDLLFLCPEHHMLVIIISHPDCLHYNEIVSFFLITSTITIKIIIIQSCCQPNCFPCKRLSKISPVSVFHLDHEDSVSFET